MYAHGPSCRSKSDHLFSYSVTTTFHFTSRHHYSDGVGQSTRSNMCAPARQGPSSSFNLGLFSFFVSCVLFLVLFLAPFFFLVVPRLFTYVYVSPTQSVIVVTTCLFFNGSFDPALSFFCSWVIWCYMFSLQ